MELSEGFLCLILLFIVCISSLITIGYKTSVEEKKLERKVSELEKKKN